MPVDHDYHTGIRRDENQVWRRISDRSEVNLEGWYPDSPEIEADWDFLYWFFVSGPNKNTIKNTPDYKNYFICEYLEM